MLHDVIQMEQAGYVFLLFQLAMNQLDADFAAFYLTNFEVLEVQYITLVEVFRFKNCFAGMIVPRLDDVEIRR